MKLPNVITFFRLVMIPVFLMPLAAVPPMYGLSLAVFIVAAATDLLDGLLARRTGTATRSGSILDPVADKLMILSAFVALTVLGDMPLWFTALAFTRDFLILAGWSFLRLAYGIKTVSPSPAGKANTFLQVVLVVILLGRLPLGGPAITLTALATATSGIDYLIRAVKSLRSRTG